MKRIFFSVLFIMLIATAFAQKIPFQGKLTQNDEPFSGNVTLKFSIPAVSWSETHSNVGVLDGFYSVVLGEVTPLPDTLFSGVDERELKISVNDVALSSVKLYRPIQNTMIKENFNGGNDKAALMIKRTGVDGSAYAAAEVVSEMDGDSYALYGQATGKGSNYGVYGYSRGVGKTNWGVFGIGRGEGSGEMGYDVGSYNEGVVGFGRDNAWGNIGVWGRALGAQGVDNIGVVGWSEVNNQSDTILNIGTLGWAKGPGTNYGIRGMADSGVNNWAGWFDGNVNVNGELMINGEPLSAGAQKAPDSIKTKDVQVLSGDGKMKAHLNVHGPNNAGSLVLNGANDSTKVILGSSAGGYGGYLGLYDSLRNVGAQLRVSNKGRGNLFMYNDHHLNSGWFGNNNFGGFMQIVGYNQEAVFTGATLTGFNGDGLPYLFMEGSSEDPYVQLISMGGSNDGISEKPFFNLTSSSRGIGGIGSALSMGISTQDQAFIELKGGNDRNWDVRAQLRVDSVGSLGTAGRLELLGPIGNQNNDPIGIFSVGAVNDPNGADPTGAGAEMFLWGSSSPNIQMGGKAWENNNLGSIGLYGSHDDGFGWYQNNVNIDVHVAGAYEAGSLSLRNTQPGGFNATTVELSSNLYGGNGGGLVLRNLADSTTIELTGESGEIRAIAVYQTSDQRLKEEIRTQQNSLEKIKKLRGVNFEWKADKTDQHNLGFIAQEVEKVYPEVVNTKEDGFKSVNYAVLVSALVEAVKELDAKVTALEAENLDLKADIANQENDRIAKLQREIDAIKALLGASAASTTGASK